MIPTPATITARLSGMDFATEIAALQDLLAGADRAVVLTGLGFGRENDLEINAGQSDWAANASLETLLVDPGAVLGLLLRGRDRDLAARAHPHISHSPAYNGPASSRRSSPSRRPLHAKAGATDVIEMHGNVLTAKCERCNERYGLPEVGAFLGAADDGVPRCTAPDCGYPLRPSGTLWGEPLAEAGVKRAWELAANSDAFISVDSALRTIPLSLLPSVPLTRGVPLAMIGQTRPSTTAMRRS